MLQKWLLLLLLRVEWRYDLVHIPGCTTTTRNATYAAALVLYKGRSAVFPLWAFFLRRGGKMSVRLAPIPWEEGLKQGKFLK